MKNPYWYKNEIENMIYESLLFHSSPKVLMTNVGHELLNIIHVQIHGSQQWISNIASDWVVAVLSANQVLGLKIFVK